MEVKLYVNSSLSLSSNLINSHVSSSSTSNIFIDPDNFEFKFEMVALEANNNDDHDTRYTSLKDISPVPELGMSRKESWREVPLKDPLVQQAAWAWAYLPFTKAEHQRSSFAAKLKDGFVGCFKNVILALTGKILPADDENYFIHHHQETCKIVDSQNVSHVTN
ncbi:hypothetical protein POM88_023031 [Heracleum sosnowskyi]|uniref:Uncharacterized protein n=1 Tax=Heracleum sosnowskyi TaxID=360622 RepID=A0AAD8IGW0_9APIA|nr:hypothetical protein POM88_023031 [Heracleum sosnowskyi]